MVKRFLGFDGKQFTSNRIKKARTGRERSLKQAILRVVPRAFERKEVNIYQTANLYGGVITNTNSYFILPISLSSEGTDILNRIGRKCKHSSLEWKIAINQAGSGISDYGTWWIVLDRQVNGASFSITEFLEGNSNNAPTGLALRNTGTDQERFKVLKQEMWQVGQANQTGYYIHHGYLSLDTMLTGRDAFQCYGGTSGSISNCDYGCIYLVVAQASSYPTATLYTQVQNITKYRFTDA